MKSTFHVIPMDFPLVINSTCVLAVPNDNVNVLKAIKHEFSYFQLIYHCSYFILYCSLWLRSHASAYSGIDTNISFYENQHYVYNFILLTSMQNSCCIGLIAGHECFNFFTAVLTFCRI